MLPFSYLVAVDVVQIPARHYYAVFCVSHPSSIYPSENRSLTGLSLSETETGSKFLKNEVKTIRCSARFIEKLKLKCYKFTWCEYSLSAK